MAKAIALTIARTTHNDFDTVAAIALLTAILAACISSFGDVATAGEVYAQMFLAM